MRHGGREGGGYGWGERGGRERSVLHSQPNARVARLISERDRRQPAAPRTDGTALGGMHTGALEEHEVVLFLPVMSTCSQCSANAALTSTLTSSFAARSTGVRRRMSLSNASAPRVVLEQCIGAERSSTLANVLTCPLALATTASALFDRRAC